LIWFVVFFIPLQVAAAEDANQVDAFLDAGHTDAWNRFADKVMNLHHKQIAGRNVKVEERVGEYGGEAAKGLRFRERRYVDSTSGKTLSVVRTDRRDSSEIHIGEVFIHDSDGRIMRDYAFIYLPWARGAPIRTFINLHHYPEGLHAYRQFDASGDLTFESCEGEIEGQRVRIRLSDDEIHEFDRQSSAYQACFQGIARTAGAELVPH